MSRPLTARALAKLPEGEHAVGRVPGLVLRVRNGARTFRLRYRTPAGVMRNMNLGRWPDELSLEDARNRAAEIRGAVKAGRDPAAERQAEREALRMIDLFGETDPDDTTKDKSPGWYLETYVRTAGKIGTAKTAAGIYNDRSYIATHLRSRRALMRKRVDEVTPGELNAIKAATRPSTWRKLRNILRVAFEHAGVRGVVEQTKAATDAKRERFLTPAERGRLEAVLAKADEVGPLFPGGLSPHLVRAIRLLSLTGMRRGDVLAMQWDHVDWRHGLIKLPTGKTGARDVPLTPQAIAFLKAERKRTGGVGFVCSTTAGGPVHPENVSRAWQTLRKRAGLVGVRLHDVRHSWASDAVSAGVPLYVVGAVLGHKQPSTTARYAHLHDRAVREGLAVAGAAIEAATREGAK